MTSWLLLTVPILVFPVVLFLGFAGCHGDTFVSTPAAPTKNGAKPGPGSRYRPPTPPTVGAPQSYDQLIEGTPGLIAYWHLNETSGTIAHDTGPLLKTGSPIDGTFNFAPGGTSARELGSKAPLFDGTSAYVEVPPVGAPFDARLSTPAFSIEAWVNVRGDPTARGWNAQQAVVSFHEISGTPSDRGFVLMVIHSTSQSEVQGILYTDTGAAVTVPFQLTGGFGVPTQWWHLVLTYEYQGDLNLYVNGDPAPGGRVTPQSGYAPNTSQSLRIGADRRKPDAPVNFFNGSVEEVALYSSVLPPSDVRTHFTAASP
jgi:hypothetical protein